MNKEYELVPHTADLKLYVYGITLEELFRNALKGMFASIKPRSSSISYKHDEPVVTRYTSQKKVVARAPERELLLVDFLSEALYLSDTLNEAYFDARFTAFSDTELEALIFGVAITGFDVVEIKAVTYHDLSCEQIDGIWQATLVFDI